MENKKEGLGSFMAPYGSLITTPKELEEFKKRGFDLQKALAFLQSEILPAPKLDDFQKYVPSEKVKLQPSSIMLDDALLREFVRKTRRFSSISKDGEVFPIYSEGELIDEFKKLLNSLPGY